MQPKLQPIPLCTEVFDLVEREVRNWLATSERTVLVGVDFDKTVYSSNELKRKKAEELYGIKGLEEARLHERLVREDIKRGVKTLRLRQYQEVKRQVYEVEEVGLQASDYRDAALYLRRLRQTLGVKLLIVSNRSPLSSPIAEKWLKSKGLFVEFVGVGMNHDKSEVAADRNIDIFIDNDHWKLRCLKGVVPHLIHLRSDEDEGLDETDDWSSGDEESISATASSWSEIYRQIVFYIFTQLMQKRH